MSTKLYNNLKTAVLLGALTGLILLAGALIGGQTGVVIALVLAAVMNFAGYFFSDKIALMSMQAREVGPEHPLYGIVARLASRASLPMPRVYVSPQAAPNAFATGRSPSHAAVCATEGLLQMLTPDEVAGVMGHELAHVRHRDILIQSVAATIAAAISVLGYLFMWGGGGGGRSDDRGGSPAGGLLVLLLGPLAAGLIQAAISRSREFNADMVGAELAGSPWPLATALEKIHGAARRIPMDVNPAFNSLFIAEPLNAVGESIGNLFRTHPPLEQRLVNLIGRESTGAGRFRYGSAA